MSKKKKKTSLQKASFKKMRTSERKEVLEQMKTFICNRASIGSESETLMEEVAQEFLDWRDAKNKNGKIGEKFQEKINQHSNELVTAFSLDTKLILGLAVNKKHKGFALEMCAELEKEYEAETASEKALIQSAVSSYCRSMRMAELFDLNIIPEYLCHERVSLSSVMSREIDRSQRQFLTALQTLKQMKAPSVNVKVHAKTAFVAENQQNISNVTPENNETQ